MANLPMSLPPLLEREHILLLFFFNLKNPEEKENIDKHSAVLMVQDSGGFEHRDDRLHSHQDFALSVTVDSEIQPSASESTMFKVMYNVYSKKKTNNAW